MDGNGRWAQARALPRTAGHRAGADTVRRIVEAAPSLGIDTLTLYAFSADNWKRPKSEVSALLSLFRRYLHGEKLKFTQADVGINGWSVETRVYAEDPYRHFLPSTGRLIRYWPSKQLREKDLIVRVDDGVADGGEVSMFYDPMIAKLITWGETRDEAADLQVAAVDAFEIEGLGHNLDFLSAIMQHPRFRSGELTTGFIAEEYPDGFEGAATSEETLTHLAAIAGFVATARADRARQVDGQLADPLEPPYAWSVKIGNRIYAVELGDEALTVDGEPIDLAMEYTPGDRLVQAEIGNHRYGVRIAPTRTGFRLTTHGASHVAQVVSMEILMRSASVAPDRRADANRFKDAICASPAFAPPRARALRRSSSGASGPALPCAVRAPRS
jgi:propionyl-CoA carboxylase alpha chain